MRYRIRGVLRTHKTHLRIHNAFAAGAAFNTPNDSSRGVRIRRSMRGVRACCLTCACVLSHACVSLILVLKKSVKHDNYFSIEGAHASTVIE